MPASQYDWLFNLHVTGGLLQLEQPARTFVKLALEGVPANLERLSQRLGRHKDIQVIVDALYHDPGMISGGITLVLRGLRSSRWCWARASPGKG
jgi:hypothetical protein